jgi:hypothetical protein
MSGRRAGLTTPHRSPHWRKNRFVTTWWFTNSSICASVIMGACSRATCRHKFRTGAITRTV